MSDIYDPTAPDGDANRGSQYVNKRDIRVVAVALLVLAAAAYPLFLNMVRRAHRSICANNMAGISIAVQQYAVLHDDRFPPIMRTNGFEPDLGDSGHPYTWASDVDELMNPRASFKCPAATDSEVTWIEGRQKLIPLTYGMYQPFGGTLRTIVANPDQSVLIAETSNGGKGETYDPVPFKAGFDGFLVGWNDSNETPGNSSQAVTRLAFPKTEAGKFLRDGDMRHEKGIHGLNCNGAMIFLKPTDAYTHIQHGLPSGLWQIPPISGVHRKVIP